MRGPTDDLAVDLPDGRTVRYTADAAGRRVERWVEDADGEEEPDSYRRYVYKDQLNPIAVLDRDGDILQRFVVDTETGEVVQRMEFDTFGQVLQDTAEGFQPFGFAGGLYEPETGLVRFGARDYDPTTGRWTAKDPIGFGGGDTNLYGYVFQDPVNFTDPTGNFAIPWGPLAVGTGIAMLAHGGALVLSNIALRQSHPEESLPTDQEVMKIVNHVAKRRHQMTPRLSEKDFWEMVDRDLVDERRAQFSRDGEWDQALVCASYYARGRKTGNRFLPFMTDVYVSTKMTNPIIPLLLSTDSQGRPPAPPSPAYRDWAKRGVQDAR